MYRITWIIGTELHSVTTPNRVAAMALRQRLPGSRLWAKDGTLMR